VHLATHTGDLESVSFYQAQSALQMAEAGEAADALRTAIDTVQRVPNRDTTLVLAMAFARAGDVERARELEQQVRRERPKDTLIQNFCLPSIDAAIALREQEPQAALATLHASLGYEFANVPGFGNLYPVYLRGLAYMEAEQPQLAIVEFRKVLDHPTLVGFSVLGPLSRLQIARAYAATSAGSSVALDSYEAFLNTWKSSDQSLAVYRAAKAEVTKLGAEQH
jgi:tetratricopeptide (TPR) repeat protein